MKAKLLIVVSLLFILPIFSQENEIFGISRNSQPENIIHIATVNPITGFVNELSDVSHSENLANLSYTVDPFEQIFYYVSNYNLLGVSMVDGSLQSDVAIIPNQLPFFQYFIFNEITQEILGLERGGGISNGEVYLSKINPETGVITTISEEPIASQITMSGYDVDLGNQWFHFVSEGKILSVDIETGDLVNDPLLDTSNFSNFNNLQYNANDGLLYAIGSNPDPAELFLVTIDPETGDISQISNESLGALLQIGGCAIDPFNQIYYFIRGQQPELVGVDIETGDEVSATSFDYSEANGAFFGQLYFGGITQTFVLSEEQFPQVLDVEIYPNPVKNILTVQGDKLSKIDLYSITGKHIQSWVDVHKDQNQIDLTAYSQGVYLLKIYNDLGNSQTLKLIKE